MFNNCLFYLLYLRETRSEINKEMGILNAIKCFGTSTNNIFLVLPMCDNLCFYFCESDQESLISYSNSSQKN